MYTVAHGIKLVPDIKPEPDLALERVVEGKLYNTKKARCLFSMSSGEKKSYEWMRISLYRTSNNAHFMVIEKINRGEPVRPVLSVLSVDQSMAWLDSLDELETLKTEFKEDITDA